MKQITLRYCKNCVEYFLTGKTRMEKIEIFGLLASPPTRAVMMVAEAIGVSYVLKELDPMNKSPEFRRLNPQQQIPVLVDDGFVLTESRAIIQYLVDKYAKDDCLYSKDLQIRATVNARLNFECGSLWPKFVVAFRPVYWGGKINEEGVQSIRDILQVVEEFLTRSKWIAGPNLTIADFSLVTSITFLTVFQFDMTQFPKICNWLKECKKNISSYKINEEGIKSSVERLEKLQKKV